MPVIPALRRLTQKDRKFQSSLGYIDPASKLQQIVCINKIIK
jgi:hypothetical protein